MIIVDQLYYNLNNKKRKKKCKDIVVSTLFSG